MDDNTDSRFDEVPSLGEAGVSDEVLRALSNARARQTLRWVDSHPQSTLDEVADAVAGFEAARTGRVITSEERERIRLLLYHVVLPMLAELELVTFDAADKTVERGEIPRGVASLLDLME